eukprot:TRINITY_DN26450_c0_g1_i1.p1 TRINITY_DN26450_c0_g1~~TRINITY_DN26450_c0_g1_i1.p1  ORF type:complete len:105 (-),score=13.64 TRINITY_DN26450_c0_g1_i1:591-905(-)
MGAVLIRNKSAGFFFSPISSAICRNKTANMLFLLALIHGPYLIQSRETQFQGGSPKGPIKRTGFPFLKGWPHATHKQDNPDYSGFPSSPQFLYFFALASQSISM